MRLTARVPKYNYEMKVNIEIAFTVGQGWRMGGGTWVGPWMRGQRKQHFEIKQFLRAVY